MGYLSRVIVPVAMRITGAFSVDDVMAELRRDGFNDWPYRDQVGDVLRRQASRGNLERLESGLYRTTPKSEAERQLWEKIQADYVDSKKREVSEMLSFLQVRANAALEAFDELIAVQLDQDDAREFRRMLRRIVPSPLAPDYDPLEVPVSSGAINSR